MIALLRASHIQPAVAVTAIATALALSVGRGVGSLAVAAAVGAGQLSVGWSNDYLDRARDRRGGRTDKPIVAGLVPARTVGIAAGAAATACVPLSLLSGWRAGAVHVGAVGVAWSYNAVLKATVLSPLAYLVAFGALPAFVTLGLPGHPLPPLWAIAAAGLLGCGAHFVNTLADLDEDVRAGVLGVPQRIGQAASLGVGVALLTAVTLVLAVAPAGHPGVAVLVLTAASLLSVSGVVIAARTQRARGAWTLTLCTAVLAVGSFLARGHALA